jgi:hypothetical protein
MLGLARTCAGTLARARRGLLDHQKMQDFERQLLSKESRPAYRKLKYIWKEVKYTFVQGFKDLYA